MKVGILVEITREFGRGICRGIAELARTSGSFSPVLLDVSSLNDLETLRGFDGFVARVMNDEIASRLAATGRPVVDVYYDKPRDGFAIVKTNHGQIGRMAAEHFLERRFVNFAFCGFAGGRFSDYCRAAFVRALRRRGASCHVYMPNARVRYTYNAHVLINEQLHPAPDARAVTRWLNALPKPMAIFCPNDLRAWQVLQICKQLQITVPHEVAILGLDNDMLVCGLANPMISSIDPRAEEIGREAAALLAESFRHPEREFRRIVRQVSPRCVVERTSTETYPIDPPWLSEALVFIGRNVGNNLTASDVYREMRRSHTSVDATFRKVLGYSVQAEIARQRLDRACHLLSTTRLSVVEIAPLCGFSSAQYLNRTFTARFGTSPAAWRRQNPPSPQSSRDCP